MKKFGKNDLFYNTLAGTPNYKIIFYNGNVSVNDQISEGSNKVSSSINLIERPTTFTASLGEGFLKNIFAKLQVNNRTAAMLITNHPALKRAPK